MKHRIAMWAGAGFLIASGWELLAFMSYPLSNWRIRELWILLRITCPLIVAGMHYPMTWYAALILNASTYALAGLIFEFLRPHRATASPGRTC